MSSRYQHPYPSDSTIDEHPFKPLDYSKRTLEESRQDADAYLKTMQRRRSVRMISDEDVPEDLIATAIETAGTAPSGANLQPWHFVAVSDPDLKHQIRLAAEKEERTNYLDKRMNDEWQAALAHLGTDWHKEFLEIAPWVVVLFEQRYGVDHEGQRHHNYYVKESCGIAAGLFISAIHNMGLVTLTHTPSPMAFISKILGRPENERPAIMFPVGYPAEGTLVPDLAKKPLEDFMTIRGIPPVS